MHPRPLDSEPRGMAPPRCTSHPSRALGPSARVRTRARLPVLLLPPVWLREVGSPCRRNGRWPILRG
eukprot:10494036-Alexandrium_andersonii.AAC.1